MRAVDLAGGGVDADDAEVGKASRWSPSADGVRAGEHAAHVDARLVHAQPLQREDAVAAADHLRPGRGQDRLPLDHQGGRLRRAAAAPRARGAVGEHLRAAATGLDEAGAGVVGQGVRDLAPGSEHDGRGPGVDEGAGGIEAQEHRLRAVDRRPVAVMLAGPADLGGGEAPRVAVRTVPAELERPVERQGELLQGRGRPAGGRGPPERPAPHHVLQRGAVGARELGLGHPPRHARLGDGGVRLRVRRQAGVVEPVDQVDLVLHHPPPSHLGGEGPRRRLGGALVVDDDQLVGDAEERPPRIRLRVVDERDLHAGEQLADRFEARAVESVADDHDLHVAEALGQRGRVDHDRRVEAARRAGRRGEHGDRPVHGRRRRLQALAQRDPGPVGCGQLDLHADGGRVDGALDDQAAHAGRGVGVRSHGGCGRALRLGRRQAVGQVRILEFAGDAPQQRPELELLGRGDGDEGVREGDRRVRVGGDRDGPEPSGELGIGHEPIGQGTRAAREGDREPVPAWGVKATV